MIGATPLQCNILSLSALFSARLTVEQRTPKRPVFPFCTFISRQGLFIDLLSERSYSSDVGVGDAQELDKTYVAMQGLTPFFAFFAHPFSLPFRRRIRKISLCSISQHLIE